MTSGYRLSRDFCADVKLEKAIQKKDEKIQFLIWLSPPQFKRWKPCIKSTGGNKWRRKLPRTRFNQYFKRSWRAPPFKTSLSKPINNFCFKEAFLVCGTQRPSTNFPCLFFLSLSVDITRNETFGLLSFFFLRLSN